MYERPRSGLFMCNIVNNFIKAIDKYSLLDYTLSGDEYGKKDS